MHAGSGEITFAYGRDKQALATYEADSGVVKTCLQLIVFHAVSRTK